MYKWMIILMLLLFSSSLLAQQGGGITKSKGHRVFLLMDSGASLDLPALQDMGVRIVSVRPDSSGKADVVVEALVDAEMLYVLENSGMIQKSASATEESP